MDSAIELVKVRIDNGTGSENLTDNPPVGQDIVVSQVCRDHAGSVNVIVKGLLKIARFQVVLIFFDLDSLGFAVVSFCEHILDGIISVDSVVHFGVRNFPLLPLGSDTQIVCTKPINRPKWL